MPDKKKTFDWEALVDVDLPDVDPITNEVVEENMKRAGRMRGAVRLGIGKIWTKEDFAAYRVKVNSRPLP